jgi:hypothetical protein
MKLKSKKGSSCTAADGKSYGNGETWKQDKCTTCRCEVITVKYPLRNLPWCLDKWSFTGDIAETPWVPDDALQKRANFSGVKVMTLENFDNLRSLKQRFEFEF